jgi:hypothetical protein
MRKFCLFLLVLLASPALAATVYVAQSAGVISDGSNCNGQTAISIATFNSGSESAGNTYWFDGAITTPPTIHGSGSAGNVITFQWCTGARISVASGQIININGANHHLLFDGGITCGPGTSCDTVESANPTGYATGQAGIIEATANGSSPLANQSATTQAFYGCSGCHEIEIRNLIVRNLYQHTSLSDITNSADTGDFIWQCSIAVSGCTSGTISIHDMNIHDNGNAISIQSTSSTTVNIFNNDFWHNNWAMENSGNGTRTLNFYQNTCRDTSNWDTTVDKYHHNCVHNYMNVSSDSLGLNFYNNLATGSWGACCTTVTLTWSEVAQPANFNIFNNVNLQSCADGQTAQAFEPQFTNGIMTNNTLIGCATVTGNTESTELHGSSITFENNAITGYGQYVVVDAGTTFTALDYNTYGAIGISGNSNWQYGATGVNCFNTSQSVACSSVNPATQTWQGVTGADAHGQKVTSLGVNSLGVPQAGSALIGAGVNLHSTCSGQPNPGLGALCFDYAGVLRPSSGAWDVGAYQSSGSTSYTLTVTVSGPGTVTSSPSGISCPGTCSASYPAGTNVTLTATTGGADMFSGWSGSGGCIGTGTCVLTMNAAEAATATFTGPAVTLSTTSVAFGSRAVGTTSSPRTVTLTNSGTPAAALTINSLVFTPTGELDFTLYSTTCPMSPSTLAAAAHCNILVKFTPQAVGARSATLSINDNAFNSPQTVSLTGTGQ